ncbi:hypothetical protein LOZ39_004066 [Ophidiomyces ophidiicola]|uniref:uncharacterized protein n=1 Tax=Ophidiomyces ophidiicola TaxID=1387563 RepID=UPI0020C4616A|nr:uncharacterized protein LOZ57_006247 [Ophidiomyces ophidiicola]KAI1908636.1 hypothetical protein LOZ64_005509 [Ophidiomyces ophidiicola]KAI1938863.1 hypothetical protein LOZ57_006247 [Ophidiomyces ophidiicola]KAI2002199.1 hypothetical protein LOZ50_005154 [Ophidiomyces ophidiicola]KAI2007692.1 hypothetical protein LOZ49_004534 [Ophidiomyces ophidiicola]KAI2035031.1 hypothetical protein LOZ47_004771 [Ophidiomyces ophidiicola]
MENFSDIELQARSGLELEKKWTSKSNRSNEFQDEQLPSSALPLPPVDRGIRAWLFLVGAFLIESLIWGLPFSYGVFQDFYETHEPFESNPSGIAAIGTTALGVMYLGSPVCFALMEKWLFWRKWSLHVGLSLLLTALVASAFATKVWHLIFTQGALYGIGGALSYNPAVIFCDEWFVCKKGFAFGVMWAGTGFAGVTIPFLMSWMLKRFGLKVALLSWAAIVALLLTPLIFFVRPRIPRNHNYRPCRLSLRFCYNRTFIFLQLGNILEGLGHFMPTIYLPAYARNLGVRNEAITTSISLVNAASIFGSTFLGFLIDRFHVTTVILISTIGATLSIFLLWGLSSSAGLLFVFSIAYGFFAGGNAATYAGILKEVSSDKPESGGGTGMVIGMLSAGRGIGSVACGPLSEILIRGRPWAGKAGLGYGTEYGPLIIFTGTSALLGGIGFAARKLGWMK